MEDQFLLLASLFTSIGWAVAERLLGGHELANLVPDHLLPDRQRNVLMSVVHQQMGPNECRDDRVASGVCLYPLPGDIRLDCIQQG